MTVDSAQRNPYGLVNLLTIPSDMHDQFNPEYLKGLDDQMARMQAFMLAQSGRTFKIVPSKAIFLKERWADLSGTNPDGNRIWFRLREKLDAEPVYDHEGERVYFGNPRRVIIHSTIASPHWSVWNMWGRAAWGVPPDSSNPCDPAGPSAAGGPTGTLWLDVLAGLRPAIDIPATVVADRDPTHIIAHSDGHTIHELLHALMFPHCQVAGPTYFDGPDAWNDPLGGQWNFWRGLLVPRNRMLVWQGPTKHFFA